jgi:putative peptide zinc metalloprotease protein
VLELIPLQPFLKVLLPVVSPLKWGIYLLPLLLLAAVMLLVTHWDVVSVDLSRLSETTTLLTHVIFSLFTVNLAAVLTLATVAYHYRASVGSLGIGIFMGFLPRFVVRIRDVRHLSRRERIWLHGAPLLMRLLLFSVGVVLWFNVRDAYGDLARAGLALSFIAAINLIVASGNPLVRGNAYHLLAAVLDQRRLRGRSFRALMEKLRGGGLREADGNLLAGYGLASLLYAYLLAIIATLLVLHFLLRTTDLGGTALLIAGALGVYLTGKAIVRFQRINTAYHKSLQFERWRKRALPAEGGETVQVEPATESRLGVYLRRALIVTLLLLLFLPYSYEPGGRLKMFPSERQVLTSDIGGIVEEVNYDGGETLAKGTVVARIASTDLRAQTSVLAARISEQEALIRDLRARPKREEVAVAQSMVDLTRQRAQFSAARVPRTERLYADRVIAFEELDAIRKEAEVDAREVARAEAALALARTGTTPERIAAEQARLAALGEERAAVEGRIGRTTLTMPFDGTLLTLRLKERLNSLLERGAPFATVEATRAMQAEIDLPEVDIAYVRVGAPIRVRANAFAGRDYAGTVVKIDRDVTAQSFGSVVKVIAEIDNPDQELRTGMTGYAKVEGVRMPVWKAFTLALQRFFQLQVWAWIP